MAGNSCYAQTETADAPGTLRELKTRVSSASSTATDFELKVRLTFWASSWLRFRVQQEGVDSWFVSTPDVEETIGNAGLGALLLLKGRFDPHRDKGPLEWPFPVVDSVEVIEDGSLKALTALPAVDGRVINLFRFVQHSGIVTEVLNVGTISRLNFVDVDNRQMTAVLHADHDRGVQDFSGQMIQVFGNLERANRKERDAYRVVMMQDNQIRPLQSGSSHETAAGQHSVVGQAFFADHNSVIVNGARVTTAFADQFVPGKVYQIKMVGWSEEERVGRLVWATQLAPDPAKPSPLIRTVSATEIKTNQCWYERVVLTGELQDMTIRDKSLLLRLKSGDTYFNSVLRTAEPLRQLPMFETGSELQLEGIVDRSSHSKDDAFTLRLGSLDSITVKNSSLNSLNFLRWFAAGLGVCLAVGLAWQVSLRRKVHIQTQQLRSLNAHILASTQAVNDGILTMDAGGNVVFVDPKLETLLGIHITEAMPHAEVGQIIASRVMNADQFREFWKEAFDSQSFEAKEREWEFRNSLKWISVSTAPVLDDQQKNFGRIWTFNDVTDRRIQEQEDRQTQKTNALGRLAGGIAHDFNNLLHAVSASLEVIVRRNDSPGLAKMMTPVTSSLIHGKELTRQLLTFSKQSPISLSPVCLAEAIQSVRVLLEPTVGPRIEIKIELDDDLWPVYVDAAQLEHVLVNLCLNSRDAIEDSGVIRIMASNRTHPDGDVVQLTIEDNGTGIAAEDQGKIFDPFFTTKKVGEGTGLGLAMVYGCIKQFEGTITCHSQKGVGTRFEIHLPRSQEPAVESEATVQEQATVAAFEVHEETAQRNIKPPEPMNKRSHQTGSLNVLIVDDDKAIRTAGSFVMSTLGHQSVQATDGQEALDYLAEHSGVDAVLLDLTMPGISGKETLREIRKLYPDLPVIVCSGFSEDAEEIMMAPEHLGPNAFLGKPFRVAELEAALSKVCKRKS